MIKTPDYEAFVRELNVIEAEWRAVASEAEAKQREVDKHAAALEALGLHPFEMFKPDMMAPLWGSIDGSGFSTRLWALFREMVIKPLRGIE